MTKQSSKNVKQYLDDVSIISGLQKSNSYKKLRVDEMPFDLQMLTLAPLYRTSRWHYMQLGGVFVKRICSTLRSLSGDDIFKFEIEYAPAESEIMWFVGNPYFVADPENEVRALQRFTDISVFHEQNHRIIWNLLPAAPSETAEFRRYLNFAEGLVVTLDAALGDQTGDLSETLLRLNLLYRPAGGFSAKDKSMYRRYLVSLFYATYLLLERVHKKDIIKAVNFMFPDQAQTNEAAVERALELNEDFTEVTNPQWQALYAGKAAKNLQKLNKGKKQKFRLPRDPLDLGAEFALVHAVLDYFDQSQTLSTSAKSGRKDKKFKA